MTNTKAKTMTSRPDIDYVTIAFPDHVYTATVTRAGQLTALLANRKSYLITTLPSEVSDRVRAEVKALSI
tara:strand:- start:395 stop:604 length:210 start_codon:yes stop_codon:yes gene_type:complete